MISKLMLLVLITLFTSTITLAEGNRVMIGKDGQYFDEIKVPENKYSGIINESGYQLDPEKLGIIIDKKGSIITKFELDLSWENPIKIKSVETITEVIRLENNVIRKVSVNEIGTPKIKSNFFFLWAGICIALAGLAINMLGRGLSVAFIAGAALGALGAGAAALVLAAFAGAVAAAAAFVAAAALVLAACGAADVDFDFSILVWLAIALMLVSMVSMLFI